MIPTELLEHLEADGFEAALNLKVTGDKTLTEEQRALIRENREALLEHLARAFTGPGTPGLHLSGDLLLNLMVWAAQHQELRLEHPNGIILNARPEHIRDAVKAHPWGVVYDCERRVLVSWGDVPTYALRGKRDLETGELLIPEAVAA